MDPSNHSKKHTQEVFKVPCPPTGGKKTKILKVKNADGILMVVNNVTKVMCIYTSKDGEFLGTWSSGGYGVDVGRAGALERAAVE